MSTRRNTTKIPPVQTWDVGLTYVASRATPERAAMWRHWRDERGCPIASTWIDEAGQGETADLGDLWTRIVAEIKRCKLFVLYVEPDDFPIKGALVEAGIALAVGLKVVVVASGVKLEKRSMRPLGSWCKHPLVRFADDVGCALNRSASMPTYQDYIPDGTP